MTANALLRWTLVHRWTSLFCTLNLTFLALTGLILIFHHEIDEAFGLLPEIEKSASGEMLPLGQLVAAAEKAKPGWSPMVFSEDDEHPGRVFVSMAPPGANDFAQTKPVILNSYTGQPLAFDFDGAFSVIVLKLHANLFAGFAGELYLALVGIAFFVALVSGVAIYAPFMRNLLFAALRRERGPRVFQLDLHNLTGIATLAWCSVVALTGVILELSKPILAIYQATDLAAMLAPFKEQPKPAQIVPLETALAAAEQAWPDHKVSFALFPGTPLSGDHHYTFFLASGSGVAKRVLKLALIEAATGHVTVARESPWYLKALFVSGPLHFGDYAGMPLKIIWALFTVLTLVLCCSGLYLFIARLRTRRAGASVSKPLIEEAMR
jgi:uncharacterized iron-regulated membrane protein